MFDYNASPDKQEVIIQNESELVAHILKFIDSNYLIQSVNERCPDKKLERSDYSSTKSVSASSNNGFTSFSASGSSRKVPQAFPKLKEYSGSARKVPSLNTTRKNVNVPEISVSNKPRYPQAHKGDFIVVREGSSTSKVTEKHQLTIFETIERGLKKKQKYDRLAKVNVIYKVITISFRSNITMI